MLVGRPLKGKWPLSHVIGLLAGVLLSAVVVVVVDGVVEVEVTSCSRMMSSSLLEMVLAGSSSPVYSCRGGD